MKYTGKVFLSVSEGGGDGTEGYMIREIIVYILHEFDDERPIAEVLKFRIGGGFCYKRQDCLRKGKIDEVVFDVG